VPAKKDLDKIFFPPQVAFFNILSFCVLFKKYISKGPLLSLHNLSYFFGERSRLYATIFIGIILKGSTNFELKFFQVYSFLILLEFLSSLRKLVKL
jgi:hypothetical protein